MTEPLARLTAAIADRYRIERELGQGGMATVYLAEDLKHKRRVAVKVLRPELAAVLGADRFVQEITTTAALQHPHILPLFDSGTADGFLYYVMPFIDGETLRSKLDRETQLGIDESVKITVAVADALDYAHRHGVIHRDIKPENILLHDGRPMVADFGIALAVSAAAGGRMTETGLSLGTPHYMSPEQATAEKDITARSDVYSLGSVLYEMLTGSPPHTGASAQQIIMKIVTEEAAPVTKLRKAVPPNVASAVAKSIEKLPADRFASAKAFGEALTDAGFTHGTRAFSAPGGPRAGAKWRWPVLVGAVAMAGVVVGWFTRPRSAVQVPAYHYYITGDSTHQIGSEFALSADGSRIAYYVSTATGPRIFQRRLDELEAHPVVGTEDAVADAFFFSPDAQWIAFPTSVALKKVRLEGGAATEVTRLGAFYSGGAWGPDGSIVLTWWTGQMFRVSVDGAVDTIAVTGIGGGAYVGAPSFLPDGRSVLIAIGLQGSAPNQIGLVSLEDGELTILGAGLSAAYVEPGYLAVADETGTLFVQPFDRRRGAVTGPRRAVATGLNASLGGVTRLGVSPSGTLVYEPRGQDALLLVNRATGTRILDPRPTWVPRFAPDGRRVLYGLIGNPEQVWLYDLTLGASQRFAIAGGGVRNLNDPTWSPDGRRLAVSAMGENNSDKDLFLTDADGAGPVTLLLRRAGEQWPSDWSSDGRELLFTDTPHDGRSALMAIPVTGGEPRTLVQTEHSVGAGRLSPDRRWLAYHSNESGSSEIYLQPYPGPGRRVRVSSSGGLFPVWSRNGRTLFYYERGWIIGLEIRLGAEVSVVRRDPLFKLDFVVGSLLAPYDVSPDGRTVVAAGRLGQGNRIAVLTNILADSGR